jgi:hypothetical protein
LWPVGGHAPIVTEISTHKANCVNIPDLKSKVLLGWAQFRMTYLAPEFVHDVFVSYAHGDADGSGNSPLKIWSTAFARELELELRIMPRLQNSGVFLDNSDRTGHSLDSNDPLTQQLRSAAAGSAFLLSLMSPHYLDSLWCKDERTWWLQMATANPVPEIGSRLFVARIWPTGDRPWPPELCDERRNPVLGVWFHKRPGDELTSRPFGWVDPTKDEEFREMLVGLAGEIGRRMQTLEEALVRRRQAAANVAKLSNPSGQVIYVHARIRDEERWERAVRELYEAGYGVVPPAPEPECQTPQEANKVASEVVRTLSACDGLLLVPGDDPRSVTSDLTVVGHQWRHSARALARKPLPCAIIDRGGMVGDKQRLQRSASSLRIDWIDAAVADWTENVRNWLNKAASALPGPP